MLWKSFARCQRMDGEAGNVGGFLSQLFGGACEHREGCVVHWDDVFHAEEADGVSRLPRAHRENIADGENGEVGLVEFADELHVAENGGVAGVINSEAAGHSNDEACRFAGVNADAVVFDGIRMEGVGHGDVKIAYRLRAALAHGTDFFFETLLADVKTSFEDGGDPGMELLCECQ